ncbi:MAG: type II methionyl aminopeptidase [Thermoplasmatales archaeon]|nr:type II methionyl aminopeptidase [Thermoplasmatales archaeon]
MEYESYKEAGKIAKSALQKGIESIKEGKSYFEVAEEIEEYIKARADLAFPVNISVNSVAAHYTPSFGDALEFKRGDVVKIDVGAHVNGFIADTAKTIEVGTKDKEMLIKSASEALEEAIRIIKAGVTIGEIGRRIEEKIRKYGLKPVRNLQGHLLSRYSLHAGISIPNVANDSKTALKEGQVIAVEPFVSNGAGYVVDKGIGNIYRITKHSIFAKEIEKKFNGLPFAERWLREIYGNDTPSKISFFMKRKLIAPYFKLVDAENGIVSQFEHTIIVRENGCEVIT